MIFRYDNVIIFERGFLNTLSNMKHLNIKLPHDCLTGSLIQLCLLTEKSIALDLTTKAAIDNWGKLRGEAVKAQMHTPE